MNYTTEDLKAEEFLTKCWELSDTIFHSKTEKTVTITSCQLQFYGKTITEVMQMFSCVLAQLQGPDHPMNQVTGHGVSGLHASMAISTSLRFACVST